MSGHSRKYKIMLTNEERNHLKAVLRSSKTCNTIKKSCQILLALDCNTDPDTTYRNCAYYLGVSLKMVCNIVKLYYESGLQRTLVLIAPSPERLLVHSQKARCRFCRLHGRHHRRV